MVWCVLNEDRNCARRFFFCWEQRWCEESKFINIMPSEKDEKEVELVQYQLVILCKSFLLRMERHGTSTTVSCIGQPKLDMSVMSWQGSHFLKFYYCSEPDLGATKLQGDILWYWMILDDIGSMRTSWPWNISLLMNHRTSLMDRYG